jgi:hypothetical protein
MRGPARTRPRSLAMRRIRSALPVASMSWSMILRCGICKYMRILA